MAAAVFTYILDAAVLTYILNAAAFAYILGAAAFICRFTVNVNSCHLYMICRYLSILS